MRVTVEKIKGPIGVSLCNCQFPRRKVLKFDKQERIVRVQCRKCSRVFEMDMDSRYVREID